MKVFLIRNVRRILTNYKALTVKQLQDPEQIAG